MTKSSAARQVHKAYVWGLPNQLRRLLAGAVLAFGFDQGYLEASARYYVRWRLISSQEYQPCTWRHKMQTCTCTITLTCVIGPPTYHHYPLADLPCSSANLLHPAINLPHTSSKHAQRRSGGKLIQPSSKHAQRGIGLGLSGLQANTSQVRTKGQAYPSGKQPRSQRIRRHSFSKHSNLPSHATKPTHLTKPAARTQLGLTYRIRTSMLFVMFLGLHLGTHKSHQNRHIGS